MLRVILLGISIFNIIRVTGQPVNDLCSGAIVLSLSSDCFNIDFTGATYSGTSTGVCPNGSNQPDLWYQITLTTSSIIMFTGNYVPPSNPFVGFRGFVEIYSDSNCNSLELESYHKFNSIEAASASLNPGTFFLRFVTHQSLTSNSSGEVCLSFASENNCPFEGGQIVSKLSIFNYWFVLDAWSSSSIPEQCDQVRILNTNQINVTDPDLFGIQTLLAACATLEIEKGGEIIVEPTYELCVGCPL